MNQVSFATVILRLIGFYVVFDLISGLAMGEIIRQAFFLAEESGAWIIGWLGVALFTRLGLGFILIFFAGKFSRFLFREGSNVILDGEVDVTALFQVGLRLLGVYFLISYLPALADIGLQWFKSEASDIGGGGVDYGRFYTPFEPILMTILSIFLILRTNVIGEWISRTDMTK